MADAEDAEEVSTHPKSPRRPRVVARPTREFGVPPAIHRSERGFDASESGQRIGVDQAGFANRLLDFEAFSASASPRRGDPGESGCQQSHRGGLGNRSRRVARREVEREAGSNAAE